MKTNEYIQAVKSLIPEDSTFQPFYDGWEKACKKNKISEVAYTTMSCLAFCELSDAGVIEDEALSKAFKKTYQTLMRNGQLFINDKVRAIWKEHTDEVSADLISNSCLLGDSYEQYSSLKFAEIKADVKTISDKLRHLDECIALDKLPDEKMKLIPADMQVLNMAQKLKKHMIALNVYVDNKPIANFYKSLISDSNDPDSCDRQFLDILELSEQSRKWFLAFEKDTFEHYKNEHPDICFENYAQLQAMLGHVGHDHQSIKEWFSYLFNRLMGYIGSFGTGIFHPKSMYPQSIEPSFNPTDLETIGTGSYEYQTTTGYRVSHAYPNYKDESYGIRNLCYTRIYSYELSKMLSDDGYQSLLLHFGDDERLEQELRTIFDQVNIDLNLGTFKGGVNDKSMSAFASDVFLNAFKYKVGLKRAAKEPLTTAKAVHDDFVAEKTPLKKMLCSGFTAKRYITVLYEFNEKLNEKLGTTDVPYVDYPFLNCNLNIILPVELHHELDKKGILREVGLSDTIKKTCKF